MRRSGPSPPPSPFPFPLPPASTLAFAMAKVHTTRMLRSLTHMHLGRRAQLTLVQMADDVSALQAALHFGRWIKLPALMLGEARINFKRAQDARKKEQQHNLRRMQLGIKVADSHFNPRG